MAILRTHQSHEVREPTPPQRSRAVLRSIPKWLVMRMTVAGLVALVVALDSRMVSRRVTQRRPK